MKKSKSILLFSVFLLGCLIFSTPSRAQDESLPGSDQGRTPQQVYCPITKSMVTVCVYHPTHGCGSLKGCQ